MSDALTSPDHSPPISPQSRRRFHHQLELYDDEPYRQMQQHHQQHHQQQHHQQHQQRIVVRSSHHQEHQEGYSSRQRTDYRSDRSTHSGREEMYSLAETEVSGWARK